MEDEQGTVPDLATEDLIKVNDGKIPVGLPSQWSDTIDNVKAEIQTQ